MSAPLPPIVAAPLQSRFFALPGEATLIEPDGVSPGVTYPAGFLAGGVTVGLKSSGNPDMGVLCVSPEWRTQASSAAVFTTNAFAAAPIVVTRNETDLSRLLAVVVNSGNANACTGPNGLAVARAMQSAGAAGLGLQAQSVAVASTGIIGVQLDTAFMGASTAKAASAIGRDGGHEFGRSIMTTDRYAKTCAVDIRLRAGAVRLAVCAKGAGMISPAMATMICVVTTDAVLRPDAAQAMLDTAVAASFNRATVDGEMSTNDCALFFASGASGIAPSDSEVKVMADTLKGVLVRIALMMVADGEGATKVIKASVVGAESDAEAARVARAVADSPLVKTAMHGGDPNWGRILSSAGAALAGYSLPNAGLWLCGVQVVDGGAAALVPDSDRESLVRAMKGPELEILLDLGLGAGAADVYFSDLGHEYITINAEYHS